MSPNECTARDRLALAKAKLDAELRRLPRAERKRIRAAVRAVVLHECQLFSTRLIEGVDRMRTPGVGVDSLGPN